MADATPMKRGTDVDRARPTQPSADEKRRGTDAYVVSRINGRIVVTALDNPPRDLGSFALAASAAAAILSDEAGREAVGYGPRFADDFLAPLEDRRAATSVTIRRARLESWLSTLNHRRQPDRNVSSRVV